MKLSGSKKILFLGIILLIIAGIVVVALKGVNVSIMLKQHESINILIGKNVNIKDIQSISQEVFGNKPVSVRALELFNDSVTISAESITDEEKSNLITKINEKYETELKVEDFEIYKNSNVRVRDMVGIYIKPVIISLVIVAVYMLIIFRKNNPIKTLLTVLAYIVLTEAILVSIITIVRIPVNSIVINLMAVVAIAELIVYINKKYSK